MSSESGYYDVLGVSSLPRGQSASVYTSTSGFPSSSGYNSVTTGTVRSTYARSLTSDGPEGRIHSPPAESEGGFRDGISSLGGAITRPNTMRVDEETRYRAVSIPFTPLFAL